MSFKATSTLELLIKELINNISSGSGGPALATEATLLNVSSTLTDIFAEQKIDFELKCVEDSEGNIYQLRVTVDEPTGTPTFDYIDATGAVATPAPPLKFCSPNSILNSINSLLSGTLNVNVTNQIDITGLQSSLTAIENSVATLPDNTDGIETLLAGIQADLGNLDSDNDGTLLASILSNILLVLSELQSIESNTDDVEGELTNIFSAVSTNATEATLLLVLAQLQGSQRGSNFVVDTNSGATGNTLAGVQSVSIKFIGTGGIMHGVPVENGEIFEHSPNKGSDTVDSIPYTVPSGGAVTPSVRIFYGL